MTQQYRVTPQPPTVAPARRGRSAVAGQRDAAAAGAGVQHRPDGRVAAELAAEGTKHRQVGAADQLAVVGGDAVEGAVAQPDGAPGGAGGAVQRGPGGAAGVGFHGAGQQLGQGGVVAGGQAQLDLAGGARVVLGRAARAGAAAAAAALVAGVQQAVGDQPVQVVGGQGAADAGGVGGVVAADGDAAVGHVPVQGAAARVAQPGQAGQLPVGVGVGVGVGGGVGGVGVWVHGPILKQVILDIQGLALYNLALYNK